MQKFKIEGNEIHYVKQYNYFGLIIDNDHLLKNIFKKRVNNKIFALRKIRKYLSCESAILVYKQTILPIFDYAGFLLTSLKNSDKYDLQVMQNDALRYCKGIQLLDKKSIAKLHDSIKLLSLEQRRQKQLLNIMYLQANKGKQNMSLNWNLKWVENIKSLLIF